MFLGAVQNATAAGITPGGGQLGRELIDVNFDDDESVCWPAKRGPESTTMAQAMSTAAGEPIVRPT
jgi:hypothetical protein